MKPSKGIVATLSKPGLWVALCSLIAVLAMAVVDTGRTSPGPLSDAHSRVEGLAGPNDCSACHGGFFQDMSSACLDCHTAIEEHFDSGRGLHGRLAPEERRCASCHSDHHGGGFQMVNKLSFAKAGVPERDEFDHDTIGFAMRGEHLQLACTECHAHADATLVPEGATRFMGLSKNCASCHEDPHDGAFGRSCSDCHTQFGFDKYHVRGHDEHLPLTGGHFRLDCRECHAADTEHALEVVAGVGQSPDARACLDCHDSPHGTTFAVGASQLSGLPLAASCVACHESEHHSFRADDLTVTPEQHAASGFPLALPHDEVGCDQCHDPELARFEARFPGRERDSCAACHEDPHGGQFETGPFAAEGCVACHGREEFTNHGFDVDLHARTSLPLVASHLEVGCDDCHVEPIQGEPRLFRGTDNTCEGCHGDAHGGFFDARTAALEPVAHGDCARCHRATEFSDLRSESFNHERWTGFPLKGVHEYEGCASCHEPSELADEFGRRFGRVQPTHGELVAMHGGPEVGQSCAACHDDPHEGRFDRPDLPVRFEEREGCARCHVESSFRDLTHGFDHGLWTGFELDGAHAAQSCSACHEPLRQPTDSGRTWGPAAGSSCSDCHEDPHGGQFEVAGAIDCSKCHGSTQNFGALRFRHNWDSRFKLDDAHAALACAECHRTETIRGAETVRYKPLGTGCTDCHGVRASSLRSAGPGGR